MGGGADARTIALTAFACLITSALVGVGQESAKSASQQSKLLGSLFGYVPTTLSHRKIGHHKELQRELKFVPSFCSGCHMNQYAAFASHWNVVSPGFKT